MRKDTTAVTEAPQASQATQLVALAANDEFFHTPDNGDALVTFQVGKHHETWPVKSKMYRSNLARRFYEKKRGAPGGQAMQDAVNLLEGKARFAGAEVPVFTRVAEHEGTIYLDLGNQGWEAVEITPNGWRLLRESPVKFRRARGILPLPRPVRGGSIDDLRPFVNVGADSDWRLVVAWLTAAFRGRGPFPVLVLHGEQGSAKSTLARILRACIDPNRAPLRRPPREVRDLMIAAANGWVVALDNLSSLPPWLSDTLCCLSTGGGFSTRELYTDGEEVLFDAQRPTILTGIAEVATRSDLLDRSVILCLPAIPEQRRQTENEFWGAFERALPKILGALLDAVAEALRNYPHVRLDGLPRMADFAQWITAAEPALGWKVGRFLRDYSRARQATHELTLESSPVGSAVHNLAADKGEWSGTATRLLQVLTNGVPKDVSTNRAWPRNARALSSTLRRVAPNLRAVGVDVRLDEKTPGRDSKRLIKIRTAPDSCDANDACDAPAADATGPRVAGDARDAKIRAPSSRPRDTRSRVRSPHPTPDRADGWTPWDLVREQGGA